MVTHRPPERIDLGDLGLRRWSCEDLDVLFAAVRSSWQHLRPWMPWARDEPGAVALAAFVRASVHSWQEATAFEYGVFDSAGDVAAAVGLHARVGPGGLEVGYWVHAERVGAGVVTRAAAAVTDAAFALPGIEFIEIHCDVANVRSAAVPRRLGFTLVEVRDDEPEVPAEVGREMVWRTTRRAWRSPGHPAPLHR